MKKIFLILGIIVVMSCELQSQDTTLYHSKEITIIDSNTTNLQKYSGLNYKTIYLSNNQGITISQVFNSMPSVNLRQYGGFGSLATISLRGTNSNHTILSLNKVPLTTSANPYFDLNLLPIDLINSVNIIMGGNSSTFGSGAIGGVVDFETKSNNQKAISSHLSVGSFGYRKLLINQNNIAPLLPKILNSISYETYLGNYPIKFNQFGENIDTFRTNSKYKSLKFSNIFDLEIQDSLKLHSISIFSSNYQQQPGAVLIGRLEDTGNHLKQLNLISINSIDYTLASSIFNFVNFISFKEFDYTTNELIYDSQNKFIAFDISNLIQYSNNSESIGKYKFEIGLEYNQLVGNILQKEVGNFIYRNNLFLGISAQNLTTFLPLTYNVSLRLDKINNYGGIAYSGLIALNYFFSNKLKANAAVSRNFRFPSFNEMYYFNYGNLDLSPEKSISADISLDYANEFVNLQINGFINDINDQIVSIPKSTLLWTAQNFAKVMNYGIEFSSQIFLLENTLSIAYNHIFQTSYDNNKYSKYYKSIIPYIPQEKISLLVNLTLGDVFIVIDANRNSYLYFLPENTIDNIIPSYLLFNATLFYNITIIKSFPFSLSLHLNNLTDINYELVKNYPMPGRSITLTIGGKIEIN